MNLIAAKNLARTLMDQHGLNHWRFEFDGAKRRFGLCNHRTRVISMSRYLTPVSSDEQVRDTILHEIAHALVGPRHGHDGIWRAKALSIGCNGNRCGEALSAEQRPKPAYVGVCKTHGTVAHRYRAPAKGRKHSCPKCSPRYSDAYMISWIPA